MDRYDQGYNIIWNNLLDLYILFYVYIIWTDFLRRVVGGVGLGMVVGEVNGNTETIDFFSRKLRFGLFCIFNLT